MKKSIHRKDITFEDIKLLARFNAALKNVTLLGGGSVIWLLGTIIINLPDWYQTGGSWKIAKFKAFEREAIGIERNGLRLVCAYMQVEEATLLNLLMKFTMLGVEPLQSTPEKLVRRMKFFGVRKDYEGFSAPEWRVGYVIEMRRTDGAFR
jgi:hypothetical protein